MNRLHTYASQAIRAILRALQHVLGTLTLPSNASASQSHTEPQTGKRARAPHTRASERASHHYSAPSSAPLSHSRAMDVTIARAPRPDVSARPTASAPHDTRRSAP